MQLFDRNLATMSEPFPFGMPAFELLTRGAGAQCEQARGRLERMLGMYPAADRSGMVSRLRVPEQTSDAFFELFVLELFVDRGYELTGVERPLEHTPYVIDFSFKRPTGEHFMVEVVCCNPPRALIGPRKMLDEVFNAIDSIHCQPFQVEVVDVVGMPEQSVRRRVVHTWVESWLGSLVVDPSTPRTKAFALSETCVVTLQAAPRAAQARAGLLRQAPCVRQPQDVVTSVRRRLFEKAYKYGPLEVPLVIALNVSEEMGASRHLFNEAVHGEADPAVPAEEFLEHPGGYMPVAGAMLEQGGPLALVPAVLGFIGVTPFRATPEQGAVYYGKYATPFDLAGLGLATYRPPAASRRSAASPDKATA